MATIEQLLGKDWKDLAKMNDGELAVYLKDITNLEPKVLPRPLGSEVEAVEPEDDNPIKLRKPRAKTGLTKKEKPKVEELNKLFE